MCKSDSHEMWSNGCPKAKKALDYDESQKKKKEGASRIRCWNCGKRGHTTDECEDPLSEINPKFTVIMEVPRGWYGIHTK